MIFKLGKLSSQVRLLFSCFSVHSLVDVKFKVTLSFRSKYWYEKNRQILKYRKTKSSFNHGLSRVPLNRLKLAFKWFRISGFERTIFKGAITLTTDRGTKNVNRDATTMSSFQSLNARKVVKHAIVATLTSPLAKSTLDLLLYLTGPCPFIGLPTLILFSTFFLYSKGIPHTPWMMMVVNTIAPKKLKAAK